MKLDGRGWLVAPLKLAASAMALATGFRAVSDDDFARVVIAEQWARAPRLDPSATSWLPFPFWISGSAMGALGRSLDVARGTAVVLGVAAAVLVYQAGRWLGEDRDAALGGAAVAALFPWSARLGVATVPELLAAALALLAMAALGGDPRRRLWGGLALFAATLSRYEAWPVALVFAAWCAIDVVRAARGARLILAGAGALALTGPLAWIAWNRAAHGDALHFLARVAAYRQALGGGGEAGAGSRLVAYPLLMVREEPELFALLAVAAVTAALGGPALRARLAPYARPAAIAAAQIAALSLAMMRDGAPTHHPERAVLSALLLAALAAGALAVHLLRERGWWRALALGGAVALAAALARPRAPREDFTPRGDEVAIGKAAAAEARPGEPILVEAADYGWLAVTAAFGRPEDVVPDRSVDPRDPRAASSFGDKAALRARIAASGARLVLAHRETAAAKKTLGAPVAIRGSWAMWRAPGEAIAP
jgi:4-amino-4-deoxy-L-arabinose transferase-like glycosyltransferase